MGGDADDYVHSAEHQFVAHGAPRVLARHGYGPLYG
jgi:hypothetical protein